MSLFWKKKDSQNKIENFTAMTPTRSPEKALLDTAVNLLSYILAAARKKEELILPELSEFSTYGTFYSRDYVRVSDIQTWMNLVQQTQKERAELKELTAKVEGILESEYGIKPRVKKSAK